MSPYNFSEQEEFEISQRVYNWWVDWVDTQELLDKHSKALDELEIVVKKIVVDFLEKQS